MQPVKIIIEGNYWDIQIYRGRLYLWNMDGDLKTYNWDQLINSLNENNDSAFVCSFIRGDYLYNKEFSLLFKDPKIIDLLKHSFNDINNKNIIIDNDCLKKFIISEQENPFHELPLDTEIFDNKIYAALDNGLYYVNTHKNSKKYKTERNASHLWDCPLLSLKISTSGRISLSAGSEGLFEYPQHNSEHLEIIYNNNFHKIDNSVYQISTNHSLYSDWNFSSIYNSSDINNSFLAVFNLEKNTNETYDEIESEDFIDEDDSSNKKRYKYTNKIHFQKIINDNEIFSNHNGNNKLSWGNADKIYKASNNGIDVVHFNQFNVKYMSNNDLYDLNGNHQILTNKQHIEFLPWKGQIIAGNAAYFGTIVECENAIVVLYDTLNDNYDSLTIQGPITKWRIYPRSIRYENHLHIILSDRVEIYSFNNDYFQDQNTKKFGIKFNQRRNTNFSNKFFFRNYQ